MYLKISIWINRHSVSLPLHFVQSERTVGQGQMHVMQNSYDANYAQSQNNRKVRENLIFICWSTSHVIFVHSDRIGIK